MGQSCTQSSLPGQLVAFQPPFCHPSHFDHFCCSRARVQIVEKTEESVMRFLFDNAGSLDKVQVGDYIGIGDDFNKKVL